MDQIVTPAGESRRLGIAGMNCVACVGRVERVPGVIDASVNLAARHAHIETSGTAPLAALIEAVRKAGFGTRPVGDATESARAATAQAEERNLQRSVWIAAALSQASCPKARSTSITRPPR